jgi:hypothetical protein
MTNFIYPLTVGRAEPSRVPAPNAATELASRGMQVFHLRRRLTVADTGVAVGATTIPLFIAPAGSRAFDCIVDVITAYDQTGAGTNLQVGTAALPATMLAATSINTVGRREPVESGAMVSANDIVFAVDTTIQAIVSINTSVVTVGDFVVTGVFR